MAVTYEAASAQRGLQPDRLYMRVPEGIPEEFLRMAAEEAVAHARNHAPKMSGASSGHFKPIWGPSHFGVRWVENYVWYQEMGISAFTMHNLAGKLIPMWVDDVDGSLRKKNPKIKKKTTVDGRLKVLIFRKASNKGERKDVKRRLGGMDRWVSVPKSYPGAPGRINRRHRGAPLTRGGIGGQIARGNGGVRWRHPGLSSKFFLHNAVLLVARNYGFETGPLYVAVKGEEI